MKDFLAKIWVPALLVMLAATLLQQMQQMMKKFTGGNSKMSLRKARKNLAGMNFDKLTGKGGGNIPKF